MFFSTPSTKEHTVKRTVTALVAAVLLSLALTAVASAKMSPQHMRGNHHTVRAHLSHAAQSKPAARLAHFGHHHLAV